MRELADAGRIREFMKALAASARADCRVYLTGGATAVLYGWRSSTIDVDMRPVPESDDLLRALVKIKESLQLNVELAWPGQFIPEISGWEDRSVFIAKEDKISFYHYDPYSQALAKIERGHRQDLVDVKELLLRGFVEPSKLRGYFDAIEPQLYRFPAVDVKAFRKALSESLKP